MASKIEKDGKTVTTLEDANLVAFLTMQGKIAIPYIIVEAEHGKSSRVAWDVEGDVSAEIRKFYNNEMVGIRDFVRALKETRTSMYNMKQIKNQLKGKGVN